MALAVIWSMPAGTETLTDVIEASATITGCEPVEAQWVAVNRCPACDSTDRICAGVIPDLHYAFGAERIPLPYAGIEVNVCRDCGLAYKSMLKTGLFMVAPHGYVGIARLFGKDGNQPWFPFAMDHFQACLRKT